MTNLPPTLPEFASPFPEPVAARRSGAGTVIAWIVIVVCVAAIAILPHRMKRAAAAAVRAATNPTTAPAAVTPVEQIPGGQLEVMARYAVAVKHLSDRASATTAPAVPTDSFINQLDRVAADNPIDQFRVIPVAGELLGPADALARLDRFEKAHAVVRLRGDVDALRVIYTKGPDALASDRARMLISRHHWFGELAVSSGLPASDPRRAAALEPARRTLVVLGAGFLLLGVLGVAGLVLATVAIVLLAKGRLRRRFAPPTPWTAGPLVEAFALYLVGMIGLSLLLQRFYPTGHEIAPNFVIFVLLPIALIYLRLRGIPWRDVTSAVGWTTGHGALREMGAGVVGYVAGLPLLAIGYVLTYVLVWITGNVPTHPITEMPTDQSSAVVSLFLLAAVGAPIVEETMFRGALFAHLRNRLGWWISAPVVSLIFAAIHPQGWVAIPMLGAIALVLAALREWRGSLIAPMTAHALNNAAAVLVMILVTR